MKTRLRSHINKLQIDIALFAKSMNDTRCTRFLILSSICNILKITGSENVILPVGAFPSFYLFFFQLLLQRIGKPVLSVEKDVRALVEKQMKGNNTFLQKKNEENYHIQIRETNANIDTIKVHKHIIHGNFCKIDSITAPKKYIVEKGT